MRRRTPLLTAASLVGALVLSSCGARLGAPPPPSGGQVAGRVVSQKSDGSDRAAAGGVRIGAFTTAVSAGPVMQNPPKPVVTGVTSSDGLFLLKGLRPGRYFVSSAQAGPVVAGAWVRVSEGQGASLLLIDCTDCPVPLVGSA
jgi:hypothetical protein